MSDKNSKNYYLSIGIGIGLVFGGAFGILFNNIAIGAGLGMLLGIVIGALIDKNTETIKNDIIKIVLLSVLGIIIIASIPKLIDYLW